MSRSETCGMDGSCLSNDNNASLLLDNFEECVATCDVCNGEHLVAAELKEVCGNGEATLLMADSGNFLLAEDAALSGISKKSPFLPSHLGETMVSAFVDSVNTANMLQTSLPEPLNLSFAANSNYACDICSDNNASCCGESAAQLITSVETFNVKTMAPVRGRSVGVEKLCPSLPDDGSRCDSHETSFDDFSLAHNFSSQLCTAKNDDYGGVKVKNTLEGIVGSEHEAPGNDFSNKVEIGMAFDTMEKKQLPLVLCEGVKTVSEKANFGGCLVDLMVTEKEFDDASKENEEEVEKSLRRPGSNLAQCDNGNMGSLSCIEETTSNENNFQATSFALLSGASSKSDSCFIDEQFVGIFTSCDRNLLGLSERRVSLQGSNKDGNAVESKTTDEGHFVLHTAGEICDLDAYNITKKSTHAKTIEAINFYESSQVLAGESLDCLCKKSTSLIEPTIDEIKNTGINNNDETGLFNPIKDEKEMVAYLTGVDAGTAQDPPPVVSLLEKAECTRTDSCNYGEDYDEFGDFVSFKSPPGNEAGFIHQEASKEVVSGTRKERSEEPISETNKNNLDNDEDTEWTAFTDAVIFVPQQTTFTERIESRSVAENRDGGYAFSFNDDQGSLADSNKSFVFGRDIDIALLYRRLSALNIRVLNSRVSPNNASNLCNDATEKGNVAEKEECKRDDDNNKGSNLEIVGRTRSELLFMVMKALAFKQHNPDKGLEVGLSNAEELPVMRDNFSSRAPLQHYDDCKTNLKKTKDSLVCDSFLSVDSCPVLFTVDRCKLRHRQSLKSVLSQTLQGREFATSAIARVNLIVSEHMKQETDGEKGSVWHIRPALQPPQIGGSVFPSVSLRLPL